MKQTLGYKLIGGIVIYAVLGFLLVASLVEWTFQQKAQSTEAAKLYKEALAITEPKRRRRAFSSRRGKKRPCAENGGCLLL